MKLEISDYKKYINRINALALPILLSYVTNFLFTIGDQAIIGRTSVTEYAAVSIVSNMIYALTGSLGILALSLNIIGSKYLGEGNKTGYKALFKTAFSLTLLIGIGFITFALAFGKPLLQYGFDMTGPYLKHGLNYLYIASLGLGLNMLLFVFSSYFKTVEKAGIIFKASTIASVVNLALDYTLVFGKLGMPRLGVMGAAIGTVVGLLINVLMYYRHFLKISDINLSFKLESKILKRLIKSYVPLMGQDFMESSLFIVGLMAIISRIGEQEIATYNLTNILTQMMVLPTYAYASALMTITAKANGAKDTVTIRASKDVVNKVLMIGLMVLACILVLTADYLPRLITNQKALLDSVKGILSLAVLMQVFNMPHQTGRYMLNALEEETWTMYYSIGVSILALIITYSIVSLTPFGLKGVYMGLILSNLIYALGFEWKLKSIFT